MTYLDGNVQNNASSNRWLYNGDYIKLKNLSLGYTLPQKWTRKFMIDRIRLTASCKNVCTFDNWEYGDPETGGLATRTF